MKQGAIGPGRAARSGNVLFTPRWLAGHLLALALIVLFVNLGAWQLRRLEARTTLNDLVATRTTAAPVPLAEALQDSRDGAGEVPEYTMVRVRGTFAPEHEVLLRGRSLDGRPGFNLLTPFMLAADEPGVDGAAVLVERGWVPYDHDSVPVIDAPPPAGEVEVVGRLRAPSSSPGGLAPRDPAEGVLVQSYYVDVERLQGQMPFALVPAYVTATGLTPPHARDLPLPLPPDDLSDGPHLGYAIQWFAFAVIGVVGYVILLRYVVRGERRGSAPG